MFTPEELSHLGWSTLICVSGVLTILGSLLAYKVRSPKAIVVGTMCIALGLTGISLGVWRFMLTAPNYTDDDGTMWKHQMSFVEKRSFWPSPTKYSVRWNRVGMISENNEILASGEYLVFALWNGHGVNGIKVYELIGESEQLVYPRVEDVQNLSYKNIRISHETQSYKNGRYIIFSVRPPAKNVDRLRIIVLDELWNVTQDIISAASIEGRRTDAQFLERSKFERPRI